MVNQDIYHRGRHYNLRYLFPGCLQNEGFGFKKSKNLT
jgi:hypothetical protein